MKRWICIPMLCALLALAGCALAEPAATESPAPEETFAAAARITPMPPEIPTDPGPSLYSCTADGMELIFLPPEGWTVQDLPAEADAASAGAELWREEAPEERVTLWCTQEPVGICGTGVTFDQIVLADGRVIGTATEQIGEETWFFWHYTDPEQLHVYLQGSLAQASDEEKKPELLALMESVEAVRVQTSRVQEMENLDQVNAKLGCALRAPQGCALENESFRTWNRGAVFIGEYEFTANGVPCMLRAAATQEDLSVTGYDPEGWASTSWVDETGMQYCLLCEDAAMLEPLRSAME